MQTCTKCNLEKPDTEFYRKKNKSLERWCKTCHKDWNRDWNKTNLHRVRSRHLKRQYGITVAEYLAMVTAQNNLCKICGLPPQQSRNLAVDHCHETNVVRGLLCVNCNTAIGSFKDSLTLLEKAKQYLTSAQTEDYCI